MSTQLCFPELLLCPLLCHHLTDQFGIKTQNMFTCPGLQGKPVEIEWLTGDDAAGRWQSLLSSPSYPTLPYPSARSTPLALAGAYSRSYGSLTPAPPSAPSQSHEALIRHWWGQQACFFVSIFLDNLFHKCLFSNSSISIPQGFHPALGWTIFLNPSFFPCWACRKVL